MGDGYIKTIIETIKQNHKYSNILKRNYDYEVSKIRNYSEEQIKDSELITALNKYQHEMKVVRGTISKSCKHELVISTHGSMITGKSSDHTPNPNHICHYCIACGKWLREDEVMPWASRLDFFGHPDALLVGKINSSAIVDYLQDYALEKMKENPYYTIEKFSEEIQQNIKDIRVPQKYIRRS